MKWTFSLHKKQPNKGKGVKIEEKQREDHEEQDNRSNNDPEV